MIHTWITAGDIYDYQDTLDGVHFPDVDAIVCLAGGRGRVQFASDTWVRYRQQDKQAQKLPILFFSGAGPQANWSVLSKQVRRGVAELIDPSHVILEKESKNTVENAIYLARAIKEHGWKHILLITSSYHIKRARWVLLQMLKKDPELADVVIETLSVIQEPYAQTEWRSSLQGIRVTFEEYWKWLYYQESF